MEVKAEVQMQNEVVFLFGRSLAFHCSYYDSFFWLTLHDRLECQILVKNCRVQHSCRVLLTCKKEFLSIKTSCSVWSQGGVENGERIRFSEPYRFGFRAAFSFFFFFLFPVSHHEPPHRTKRDPTQSGFSLRTEKN